MHQGINWIAVLVHQFGVSTYQYVHRLRTGLLIDGYLTDVDGERQDIVTDTTWEVKKAHWFLPTDARYTLMLGYQEIFDARMEEPN